MRQILVGCLIALAGLPACAAPAGGAPAPFLHLVVISIDGLRPDAIDAAKATNLRALVARSAYTASARTVGSPETLPSHVSMVTGLAPASHGVKYNVDRGETLSPASLFTRVQEAGGATALLFGKDKLVMLAGQRGADVAQGPGEGNSNWDLGEDRALAERFRSEFPRLRPRLAMIHLRAPDFIGHKAGWMSEDYLAAVRDSDEAVGIILAAIESSGRSGATAVILTADHGGEGDRHFSGNAASETIPWLCFGPGIKAGRIASKVRTVDVAPTGLAMLGLPPLEGIDGKVVPECLPH